LSPELAPAGFGGVGGAGGARVGEVTFEFQPRGSEERERLSGAAAVRRAARRPSTRWPADRVLGARAEHLAARPATVLLSTHRVHEVEGLGDTRSGALTETGKGLDVHFACA
jgi:hypothetical protein